MNSPLYIYSYDMDVSYIVIPTLVNRDISCGANFTCKNMSKPWCKRVY